MQYSCLFLTVAPGQASAHESILEADSDHEDNPPSPETQLV